MNNLFIQIKLEYEHWRVGRALLNKVGFGNHDDRFFFFVPAYVISFLREEEIQFRIHGNRPAPDRNRPRKKFPARKNLSR